VAVLLPPKAIGRAAIIQSRTLLETQKDDLFHFVPSVLKDICSEKLLCIYFRRKNQKNLNGVYRKQQQQQQRSPSPSSSE
jgi:hypothetical protein